MGRWGKKLGPETTKSYSTEKKVIQAEGMRGNEGTADKPTKNSKMQREKKGVQNSKKKKKVQKEKHQENNSNVPKVQNQK